jgi:hypothetical protein
MVGPGMVAAPTEPRIERCHNAGRTQGVLICRRATTISAMRAKIKRVVADFPVSGIKLWAVRVSNID